MRIHPLAHTVRLYIKCQTANNISVKSAYSWPVILLPWETRHRYPNDNEKEQHFFRLPWPANRKKNKKNKIYVEHGFRITFNNQMIQQWKWIVKYKIKYCQKFIINLYFFVIMIQIVPSTDKTRSDTYKVRNSWRDK